MNRHIVYTHGYGVVASPSNEADDRRHARLLPEGHPDAVDQRHQARRAGSRRRSTSARTSASYVLTGARVDASSTTRRAGKTDQFTRYKGKDGVKLSNFAAPRRVRAAVRRPQPADLGPDQLGHEAAHGPRHPRPGREARAVPPVRRRPVPGRARATARCGSSTATRPPTMYPYSQSHRAASSGLAGDFNYVRNSVKATVDAYDGTVTFYVFDNEGPDHQGVREGVPRPLHRRVARCPSELQRAPPLPARTCSRCRRTCSAATT